MQFGQTRKTVFLCSIMLVFSIAATNDRALGTEVANKTRNEMIDKCKSRALSGRVLDSPIDIFATKEAVKDLPAKEDSDVVQLTVRCMRNHGFEKFTASDLSGKKALRQKAGHLKDNIKSRGFDKHLENAKEPRQGPERQDNKPGVERVWH